MRRIEQHPEAEPFKLTEDVRSQLEAWCQLEIADAISKNYDLEKRMVENHRQYEGIPELAYRTQPIENAPNIEFNVAGIATDSIAAQATDLVWSVVPLCSIKPTGPSSDLVKVADATQIFANHIQEFELCTRAAFDHAVLDFTKHGTLTYFTPWTERVRMTDVAKITTRGPKTRALPLEDTLFPGGAEDCDDGLDWCGIRFWFTPSEFKLRAKAYDWDTEGIQASAKSNVLRDARERGGRTTMAMSRRHSVIDIITLFAHVPLEMKGGIYERDLIIHYNWSGNRVVSAGYMPYDHLPINVGVYQKREHLIHGIGIPEMLGPFQKTLTEFLNQWLANAMLANMRGWKGPPGAIPGDTIRMRPGKYYPFTNPDQVEVFALADTYPSMPQAISMVLGFAERRSGVNEVSTPRPSAVLGNRTPGITALTMMNQASRRFVPAFDQLRFSTAGSVKQGLYRYQERLLAGDTLVEAHIMDIMGPEQGALVVAALKDPDLEDSIKLELSASSATQNMLQERQDAIQLMGVLGSYYEKTLQLMQVAGTQGIDEVTRSTALKVASAMGEIVRRTVSKFETIKDVERFVLDVNEEINAIPAIPPQGLDGLLGLLGAPGMGAPNGQGPGTEPPSGGQLQ